MTSIATTNLVKPIFLNASSLAAFIGHNKFVKHHQAFEDMWRKIDPVSFNEAFRRNARQTEQEHIQHIKREFPDVAASIEKLQAHTPATASDVFHTLSQVHLPAEMPRSDKTMLTNDVKKHVFTTYGTGAEQDVLARLQRETSSTLIAGDGTYHKKRIGDIRGRPWYIGGKIDAMSEDGVVIEIKNRVRRLFKCITDYDMVQVQCYLHIVDGATAAMLVECLRVDDDEVSLHTMHIEKDEEAWQLYITKARTLLTYLIDFITNIETQDTYLASKQKNAFLKKVM